MNHYYTYIYRDPSRNNEPIYIGKGCELRFLNHTRRKDIHPFSQRLAYMRNNNINPVVSIIPCESEELALLVEMEAISKYGRKDLGLGPLLNLTDGGDGASGNTFNRGRKHSDESKKNMSAGQIGKKQDPEVGVLRGLKRRGYKHTDDTKAKMSAHVFSDDHKAKLSAALTGKKLSDAHRLAVSIGGKNKKMSPESEARRKAKCAATKALKKAARVN